MTIEKFSKKATAQITDQPGRYEPYNLRENPFPSSPFVNPSSTDARTNGEIYEPSIRVQEYQALEQNFLAVPQNDPNHLRLGYIMDTSYIGRGNGKTAFLTNLARKINSDFGLSISKDVNKSFAVVVVPEPSGKTKTFDSFVDLFVSRIFKSQIVEDSLISMRLDAIGEIKPGFDPSEHFEDDEDLRRKLASQDWYRENEIDFRALHERVVSNKDLKALPAAFPLFSSTPFIFDLVHQRNFEDYYVSLKRGKPRLEFVFSHLVDLFLAAGFNGSYVFVDDFERIPDFQSERQKRDFAAELRTCLFDGTYTNARVGFYNFLLVLHAGVPGLIQSAWEQSGLEHRSPIFFKGTPKNVVRFEKIKVEDAFSLVRKYLQAFRVHETDPLSFSPFTQGAIEKIADLNELNAAKILKMAYEVLERAVQESVREIDIDFIQSSDQSQLEEQPQATGISDAKTKDLMKEAN